MSSSDVTTKASPAPLVNPALLDDAQRTRALSIESRAADPITTFAGSMPFVYIHAIWFAAWIGFGVEAGS